MGVFYVFEVLQMVRNRTTNNEGRPVTNNTNASQIMQTVNSNHVKEQVWFLLLFLAFLY